MAGRVDDLLVRFLFLSKSGHRYVLLAGMSSNQ